MNTKEPYYDNDLTGKKPLSLSADLLKIPPLTDYPVSVKEPVSMPVLRTSSRTLSMEPYYRSSSRRGTSTLSSKLSSYAMLSDVFDYHYLDEYRPEDHEYAIVSDSDTDYDDIEDDCSDKYCSDSDADSELEDYKVHFLMFKVNSKAQFTKPPRTSFSSVSDNFDDNVTSRKDFSMVSTLEHPKFASPALNTKFMASGGLDEPVETIVAKYELICKNPLASEADTVKRVEAPPGATKQVVNDEYCGAAARKGTANDAYDIPQFDYYL